MAKSFREIAEGAAMRWTDDQKTVYESAQGYFEFQANQQIELGRQIARLRESSNLTQKALEEISGIQQAELSRIESGAANPTRDTLIRIGIALNQTLTFVPNAAQLEDRMSATGPIPRVS